MGNSNKKVKTNVPSKYDENINNRVKQSYLSQISLGSFANNLSGRSYASAVSRQSTYSVSRPWSRVSRRRWHETTLNDPFKASKTAWPVPFIEALFLPEFQIHESVTENDFEVVGTIAKGAFGRVYKVLKKDTRELYALKVLSKSKIIAESSVHQVKEEVNIQSMCGHNPFVVSCPFYWQNKKRLFIVSEYMPGGELFQLSLRYGPLPEDIVRLYVAEIACAIDFLHNAGVIYRDLKLENILVDADGHVQLIDFGLAKWLKYGSRTTTICGTLQYMAPEVLGMDSYGHAVDWWSLGVATCVLLTRQYPVPVISNGDPGPQDAAGCVERDPGSLPEQCAQLTPAARTLLQRLLDRSPHTRLRSVLKLQQVALFKDFSFADVRSKKISPSSLLEQYFPNGPPVNEGSENISNDDEKVFEQFDSDFRNW